MAPLAMALPLVIVLALPAIALAGRLLQPRGIPYHPLFSAGKTPLRAFPDADVPGYFMRGIAAVEGQNGLAMAARGIPHSTFAAVPTPAAAAPSSPATPSAAASPEPIRQVYWPGIRGFDGPLAYSGGPIKTGKITVHMLFYGAWDQQDINILTRFVNSINDASNDDKGPTVHKWWNIMNNMKDSAGNPVSTDVELGTVLTRADKYKKRLNDAQNGKGDDILTLVANRIQSGDFPLDPNAIYVVLTSADVAVGNKDLEFSQGFCHQYCGYHYYGPGDTANTTSITYAFVGNPAKCEKGCSSLKEGVPGKTDGDKAASVLAHEVAEVASDPFLNAWVTDGYGIENGDCCSWAFDPNNLEGKKNDTFLSNMIGLDQYPFMIQLLPDIDTQDCVLE